MDALTIKLETIATYCMDPREILEELNDAVSPTKESLGKKISGKILSGMKLEELAKDPAYSAYFLLHLASIQRYSDLVDPSAQPDSQIFTVSPILNCHPAAIEICAWLCKNIRPSTPRRIKTPQLWVSGPPSIGKSTLVDMLCERLNVYIHPYEDWYDLYDDSIDLIVLDDFHGEIRISFLNRLTDGSRVSLRRRGRTPILKKINVPVVVFANRTIADTYHLTDPIGVQALQSRFLEILCESGEPSLEGRYISQIEIK